MKPDSRITACGALLAAAMACTACSTPQGSAIAGGPASAAAVTTSQPPASESITGSRLPSKSTDRLVRSTGAAGAKEMERDRAPDPGPRVN